jgi:methionyl-tRNA formyltransferase
MGQDVNFRMTGYERPPGDFDIGVIISFGHLIRPDIIESFPLGMINAHASLLPQLKGAAPMQYALMNGLERTGVSITTLHPTSIDAGRVLHQSSFDIAPGTTFASMVPTVAQHAADDIIHVLRDWDAVAERSREQAELVELHGAVPKELRRAPKIGKALGKVEWANMTAREAVCRWQGLTGFTPVYTSFKNKRCQLLEMRVAEGPMPEQLADAPPGTAVLSQDKSALLVRCREGVAAVGEVQLECKKPSVAAQFANGYMKTVTTVLFGDQQ